MNAVVRELPTRHAPNEGAAPAERAREVNAGWEIDRAVATERSARRAWRVAGLACLLTGLAIAAVFVQGPLRQIETVTLVVDKATGETTVANKLATDTIPSVEALDMHNAARFVRAREGYNWAFLQKDYDTVMRMATPAVFTEYNRQFDGAESLDKRLGSSGEQRITIVNIRLPPVPRAGNAGEVIVTFDKAVRLPNQITFESARYVATIRFEYRPTMLQKQLDRIENPFGFVATAYRADVDLTSKTGTTGQSPS
jgi:type IV secretion system protein VirB8